MLDYVVTKIHPAVHIGNRSEIQLFPEISRRAAPMRIWSRKHIIVKCSLDVGMALAALPIGLGIGLVLLALNPFYNPGPLFFTQDRMGLGGKRFKMWKFRTMRAASNHLRAHDEGLEEERITRLGRILRRSRIDEIPNFYNVLRCEMSVIGPRPEAWEHALVFIDKVPHYRDRFRVRPGITGLAQVRGGYADNPRAVERKARFDYFYVKQSRLRLDLYILGQTILVVLSGFGAK